MNNEAHAAAAEQFSQIIQPELSTIKERMTRLDAKIDGVVETGKRIETQTIKTNGRVSALETWQTQVNATTLANAQNAQNERDRNLRLKWNLWAPISVAVISPLILAFIMHYLKT